MPPPTRGRARARAGAWLEADAPPLACRRHVLRRNRSCHRHARARRSAALQPRAGAHRRSRRPPIDAFDPRDESKTRFGQLEFRGGLVLTSSDQAFGGISALHMEPDGAHFLSLTDNGSWLRGRIVYRDGRPAGIADAEMAPILGADGKPLAERTAGTTPSCSRKAMTACSTSASSGSNKSCASIIAATACARAASRSPCRPISRPSPSTRAWNVSPAPPKGAPLAGALIAVTERSLDEAGNHRAFVLERRACRTLQRQAQRRIRRQRLHHPAARRSLAARAPLLAAARRRHPHPPACILPTSRRARWSTARR